MRTLGKVVVAILLAAIGAAAGIAGAFVHDLSVDIVGIGLPVGLPLALALAAAAHVLAGWVLRSRLAVLAPGAGWLVPVLVLSVPRSEGDLVVAANPAGYLFLLGGSVLIGLGVALPYGSRQRPLRIRDGAAHPVP